MFCTNCGEQIPADSRFCTNCGTPVDGEPNVSSQATRQYAPVASQAPSESQAPAESQATNEPQAPTPSYVAQTSNDGGSAAAGASPNKSLIITIIAVAVALIAIVIIGFVVFGSGSSPSANSSASQQGNVEAESTEEGEQSEQDALSKSDADGQYSSMSSSDASGNSESSAGNQAQSDYLLPYVSSHIYSEAELAGLSNYELYLARNEVFARHGRGFNNPDLRSYFNSKGWYREIYTPEQFDSMPTPLNEIERDNVDLIRSIEDARGSEYAV